jgi:hypothetical protein
MEELLSHLQKSKDEKKVELYNTFVCHLQDIKREKEKIMKILQPSYCFPVEQFPLVNEVSLCATGGENYKKRKSPETAIDPVKVSPEMKRISRDGFEVFLINKGYPSDASRLKKEQLIELLESRGLLSFSMKNLKAQMVDALRDSFASESESASSISSAVCVSLATVAPVSDHLYSKKETPLKSSTSSSSFEEINNNAISNESGSTLNIGRNEVPNYSSTVVCESGSSSGTPLIKTPGRKGSLMADFRNLVNGSYAGGGEDEQKGAESLGIRKELQNRLSRHRESQVRRSSLMVTSVAESGQGQCEKRPLKEEDSGKAAPLHSQNSPTDIESFKSASCSFSKKDSSPVLSDYNTMASVEMITEANEKMELASTSSSVNSESSTASSVADKSTNKSFFPSSLSQNDRTKPVIVSPVMLISCWLSFFL